MGPRRILGAAVGAFVLSGFLLLFLCRPGASIGEIVMCRGLMEGTDAPVDPTSVFRTDDPAIRCCLSIERAPAGTKVRSRWVVEEAQGLAAGSELGRLDYAVDHDCWVHYSFLPSPGGLAPGKYRVDVWVNPGASGDEPPTRTVRFRVQGK